jgi:hypothetical protein
MRGIMHGREPEVLTAAEVQDGWGELVNTVGSNLKALVRLTVLQPRR